MSKEQIPKVKARSCDVCRRRKVRCDGPTIPPGSCTNCSKSQSKCTYLQPWTKRSPNDDSLRKANESLKNECMSLQRENTRLKNENLSLRAKLQSLSRSSSRPDSLFHQEGYNSTPATELTVSDDSEDLPGDELASRFQQFSIASVKNQFFRPAGILGIANTAMAMKEQYLGGPVAYHARRRLFWDMLPWEEDAYDCHYTFPQPDLITSLVQIYFATVHPTILILHRPSFERSVAEGLHFTYHSFGRLLLAVLAVASRCSDDPRVFIEGDDTTLSAGWKFASQIQILPRTASEPTIYEVQMYCLMATYFVGTSVPQVSTVYMALGINCLQLRGDYRRKRDEHNVNADDEIWRRVFWCYVCFDLMSSVFHGRPPGFDLEEDTVDLPLETDDEYWDRGFAQPLGKPSVGSYVVQHIKLCKILVDVMRRMHASKGTKTRLGWVGSEEHRTVAELDSSMNDFLDSIPSHLRWDADSPPQDPFFDQSITLYMSYNLTQIMIHRPHIHKMSTLAAPSLFICLRAARTILHAAQVWLKRPQRQPLLALMNPVFVSGSILVLNLFGTHRAGASEDMTKDLAHLETAMEVMKALESRLQPAGRFGDLLRSLRSLEHLPMNSSTADASAASRSPDPSSSSELQPRHIESYTGLSDSALRPGVSIEQLLATSEPMDAVFDNELMLWMAAPANIANLGEWNAYIGSRHADVERPSSFGDTNQFWLQ
ncbi:fungal-specific transcription factor domain-containing protein [Mycena filopes]|nr:fungal-specific transcription factor domain-containing protein [Mycena filopes]